MSTSYREKAKNRKVSCREPFREPEQVEAGRGDAQEVHRGAARSEA